MIYTSRPIEKKVQDLAAAFYVNSSDDAHMADHINKVKERAVDMCNWLKENKNMDCDLDVVLVAATLHDIGSTVNRDDHNIHSMVLFTRDPRFKNLELTEEQRDNVSNAIIQHSSHFKGNYYSPEAEVVASADRDEPDIYNILKRATAYGKTHNPENVVDGVVEYNMARYASFPSNDYKVPKWHFEYWNDKMKNSIDNLNKFFSNKKSVEEISEMIYNDESEKNVRERIDEILNGTSKLKYEDVNNKWKNRYNELMKRRGYK